MSLQAGTPLSLPGCSFEVTSTLISGNNIYAASNGYVYLLDADVQYVNCTNSLPARGHCEVRLAMSDDGSTLLVGTNGYILGLNSNNLVTNWQTSLTGCGSGIVNILAAGCGSTGYAACNSYVYTFDIPTGTLHNHNALSGYGTSEPRLSLTFAKDILVVGIDGFVLGLDPSSLNGIWTKSLLGTGLNVTSVLGGEGCCYAGCNGYLWMLDSKDGEFVQCNALTGVGKADTRLALRDDAAVVFVGVNGWAAAVKATDISTIYQRSLPDCGFNITNVVSGKLFTYFGCNGYVYSLDENGNIVGNLLLPSLGNHETRLAIDTSVYEDVVAGVNGYAVGLTPAPWPSASAVGAWMTNNASTLGPKMLRQLAIPGTHHSGSYAISPSSPTGKDQAWYVNYIKGLPLPSYIAEQIIALWSIAQPYNFADQLSVGVRYFDLRVQGGGQLSFVHGLVSSRVSELISQLSNFLANSDNNKEIIVLDFSHFYSMSSNDHENLISLLTAAFINSLAVYNPAGSNQGGTNGFNLNATLNNFWSTKSRIIVFYNDDASVVVNNFLWPNVSNQTVSPAITSPRPDASSFTAVQSALDSELPYTGSTAFVLQCQVSPNADVITSALAGGSYNSLGALAGAGNSQIVGWLKGWGSDVGINIVIADWIQSYPTLIPTIIAMNGVDFPASIFGSLANIEKTVTPATNAIVSHESFIKGMENGTMELDDIITRTHAQAFKVFGRNTSKENVQALKVLQDFVEKSDLGKAKFVQKPEAVGDDASPQKNATSPSPIS